MKSYLQSLHLLVQEFLDVTGHSFHQLVRNVFLDFKQVLVVVIQLMKRESGRERQSEKVSADLLIASDRLPQHIEDRCSDGMIGQWTPPETTQLTSA